ncbi:hypothetical protein CONLIGDRAFT_396718 [Coniochaeta ligniaria NRRL 30616]|uniref:DUF6546 domain-containing protein n=1 Tax=Coniochaeta ligniaria NRRL 30616 TaxID=1408157 RepID=A0A1J7JGM7_9PEZI|nr:hypothetical protein CONLIGDRAFT_396718 [Coniochaeta ligniaria NRRL 30616]
MSWEILPVELRHMILENVLEWSAGINSGLARGLASYAMVCAEWQHYFERVSFGQLIVTDEDLERFQQIVARRHLQRPVCQIRPYYVWLRVVLLRYRNYPHQHETPDCLDCIEPENDEEVADNDVIFTEALWILLETLALMGVDHSNNGEGGRQYRLELELSVHSPSDCHHYFKWYHLQDDYPHLAPALTQSEYVYGWCAARPVPLDDPGHGYGPDRPVWVENQLRASGADADRRCRIAQRLVRPMKLNFQELYSKGEQDAKQELRVPDASIVTTLTIRRQYFRDISTPCLGKLLESLPSLKFLRRENWRIIRAEDRSIDDRRYSLPLSGGKKRKKSLSEADYLLTQLPRHLEVLCLFEDFEVQLHGREDAISPRSSGIQFLPSLAVSTPALRELAVGFLTEAIDCFGLRDYYLDPGGIPDHATYRFKQLELVVLTSQDDLHHCHWQTSWERPNALLRAAAAVALKMPKLKVMELWSWSRDSDIDAPTKTGCIFRYDTAPTHTARQCWITWESNWPTTFVFEKSVIAAWQKVAETNVPAFLGKIRRGTRKLPGFHLTYGDVVRRLKLRFLHPTSEMQVLADSYPGPERLLWSR